MIGAVINLVTKGIKKIRQVKLSNKLRIKQRIIEDAHLPYTLTAFSPKFN